MKKLCLLRAINVGGKNKIDMQDLKELFEQMGYENVQTHLNTGNVIFDTSSESINNDIQKGLLDRFGLELQIFIYGLDDLRDIEKAYPFEAISKHNYISFFSEPVQGHNNLEEKKLAEDRIQAYGSVIFLNVPGGYGKTKLNNAYMEKKVGKPCTTRNLNTLRKLIEKMEKSL